MKLLIGVVLLCAAFARSQDVCDNTKFKCDSANPNVTTIIIENKEYTLECQTGETCNSKYKLEPTCKPCIVPSKNCDGAFECPDGIEAPSRNIKIGDVTMLCPQHKVCNAKYEQNCELCIPVKCADTAKYECPDKDSDYYVFDNNYQQCRPGYTCNSDYFEPCQKCISKVTQRLLRLKAVV